MVIVISFKIEYIFLKFKLSTFSCLILWINLLVIKAVAFVISSSTLVVLFPFSKTDPTKFSITHLALHVVASLIFLNRFSTFWIWTLLSICDNPIYVFWLTWIFYCPSFMHFTSWRRMWFLSTLEAIRLTTETIYNILICIIQFICSIITIL